MIETKYRSCSLCEAGCGLEMDVEDNRVVAVRPDEADPHSEGYVCPKGMAIADVHNDPDRLRRPMKRKADGSFEEITWDEAFTFVGERLRDIRSRHGADSIAVYYGNPLVHSYSAVLMVSPFVDAIGTKNRTSAGSQDTGPRFASSYYLYGNMSVIPVPDLTRTDYFLCIGANPAVSQGSAMVTPDIKSHLRGIGTRGGRIVTVDPRFTETAKLADEHVFIRPGGDAAFLLAILNVLIDGDLIDREFIDRNTVGWDEIENRITSVTPEQAEAMTGIAPAVTRRIARELAAADAPVVYTRLGTCNSRYGTLATFANDLVNICLGRLGRPGGAMLPEPAIDAARVVELAGMNGHARWKSRVRGLPELGGDLPASVLAEEMETPGDGQIRAMVTIAGNPVLSTPNGKRLSAALEGLDFQVAVDLYINETTRHADVILPPSWSLAGDHSAPLAPSFAIDGRVRWDPPVVQQESDERADWEILLRLAEEMGGGPTGTRALDMLLKAASWAGWKFEPAKALDMLMRLGPHGDGFMPWRSGIRLADLQRERHGIPLGTAKEGFAHRIRHRDRRVHVEAEPILDALSLLHAELDEAAASDALLLIGRRDLRSNNSWMHNVEALVSGRPRCVLYVHPDDASRAGLRDSEPAWLENEHHGAEVPVRVTDEVMQGVVSLPHGWGHAESAPWQSVAGANAGVSANNWTNDQDVESVVGQSILNGVRVRVSRAAGKRHAA